MTSQEIRRQFIDFFVKRHAHVHVPSAPVVPHDDPTLLFTNAGMNQFKPIFLGLEQRPYSRAVNSQKCIRAGGKHNDLDDVGRSRRHHTFFEMLGNWSFGDYQKRGAIEMAWELLREVWKLEASRLHVSVHEGNAADGLGPDEEAAKIWKEVAGLPDDHIHYFGSDNFWEMGETGPCGPCSEIYVDRTPDGSGGPDINGSNPLVMEIWNLVFIQFNRGPDRTLTRLPQQHVDTGMGLERVCQVLQDKQDNYATDLFTPLFEAIAEFSGAAYRGSFEGTGTQLQVDTAFRVIADHGRMATVAVTDGAVPSNKKRGAVVRSVIRRAVRFGYQVLGMREPFVHRLVPVMAEQLGDVFPELRQDPARVAAIIRAEEEDFLVNIDRGLRAFEEAARTAQSSGGVFAGKEIFYLHSTLGFPADMTMQLAAERGLRPDRETFEKINDEFRATSGQGRQQHQQVAVDLNAFFKTDDSPKYQGPVTEGHVLGWVRDAAAVRSGWLEEDATAALLLDRTSFYAEQGGQVGDVGQIETATGRFEVSASERKGDWVLHWGTVAEGRLEANQSAKVLVDNRRADTMRNHTATHLMNWALRRVLGDHIQQQGSLVDPQKLRFDFSHPKAVTPQELAEVERLVNEQIYLDQPVTATVMPLADAKKLSGVRAVFGEKYPDPVRVVAVGAQELGSGDHSIEFCGGTHLHRTGEAGFFKIVAEESVSKAVRRVTAVTGPAAVQYVQELAGDLRQIAQMLSVPPAEAPARVASLQEEIKQLCKKGPTGSSAGPVDAGAAAAALLKEAQSLGDAKLIVGQIPGAADEQLRGAIDSLKKKALSHAVMLGSAQDDKVTLVAAVSDDLIARGLKAGDWVREAAQAMGGSGGGRPQMAQAGGKDPAKLAEALEVAVKVARRVLGG